MPTDTNVKPITPVQSANFKDFKITDEQFGNLVNYLKNPVSTGLKATDMGATPIKVTPPITPTVNTLAPATPTVPAPQTDTQKKDALVESISKLAGETTPEAKQALETIRATEQGKQDTQLKFDAITNDIAQTELKTRRKIEDLRASNPEGLFGALDDEIKRIQYENDRNVADKMIIQSALQNNLARIQEIAKSKAEIKFAPKIAELESKKIQLNDIYNTLTASEKKQADELKRKYEVEDRNYNAEMEMAKTWEATKASIAKDIFDKTLDTSVFSKIIGAKNKSDLSLISASFGVGQQGVQEKLYSGLPAGIRTEVSKIANNFDNEQLVKNFGIVQEGNNFANSIPDNNTNPADDQGLIYALAKVLDPNSVVREGEYATAQKYSQSWINAYGKTITQAIQGTGFLSEEARRNIKNTIKSRAKASEKTYDNIFNEYGRKINAITGAKNGTDYITDYKLKPLEDKEKNPLGLNVNEQISTDPLKINQ